MTRSADQTWHGVTVLLPHGAVEKAHLVLRRGKINGIIPGSQPAPGAPAEADMTQYLVTPGLVNAHDHLDFNCFPPYAPHGPYKNASSWFSDVRAAGYAQALRSVMALPRKYRLLAGGFKNLLSGVTTAAHHNPPVRSLHSRRFPVTVPRNIGYCHSLATDPHPAHTLPGNPDHPWVIHAAEGTDGAAAGELTRLNDMGCLGPGSVLVHCLGLDQALDPAILSATRSSVVWCPSSNQFLYQAVAPIRLIMNHAKVALGTDSTISGGGGMLEELRAARLADPELDLSTLLKMATSAGADLLGMAPDRGAIATGSVADLTLFRLPGESGADPLLAPFQARRPSLVLRNGIPLVADAAFRPLMESMRLAPLSFQLEEDELWMPRRLHRLFARTVEVTRGWPPFGEEVQFH